MELGKKPAEHIPDVVLYQGRGISQGTLWWIKSGQFTLDKLFCVHNRSLDVSCDDCDYKPLTN
jgi:hypothetical protein